MGALDVAAKRITVQEHQLATEVTGVPHYLDFEFGALLVICKAPAGFQRDHRSPCTWLFANHGQSWCGSSSRSGGMASHRSDEGTVLYLHQPRKFDYVVIPCIEFYSYPPNCR